MFSFVGPTSHENLQEDLRLKKQDAPAENKERAFFLEKP